MYSISIAQLCHESQISLSKYWLTNAKVKAATGKNNNKQASFVAIHYPLELVVARWEAG